MRRAWITLLAPLLLWQGCAASTPQEAVASYGEAVSGDDAEAAWEQLSPALRQKVDLEGFQAAWETRRAGLLPLAEDLKQAPQRQARVWASLDYSDYDTLTLKLTDGGWRITGGVLDVYSQDSPRKALVTFVRAAERQRFDVLLRLVPSRYARHMSPEGLQEDFQQRQQEIQELLAQLKANLQNPIEVREDRAFLNYGRHQVRFLLEGEAWKIEDLD